ncbi:MAG: galactose-1-phosphate uridylyltransferase [Planctomycetales bacterium]|nr:galactose-1-phosphate uridylyltransferase [Planctomycetales bacterium]
MSGMPDLRHDPLSDRWVIIAENRAKRPQDFTAAGSRRTDRPCPFCRGHEGSTPGEVLALRPEGSPADGPGWRVRVVPNKYPILQATAARGLPAGEKLFASQPATGIHEVIIESPRHATRTSQLTTEELREVILTYRHRLGVARRDDQLVYGLIFKNVGPQAGATIEHLHSQMVGMSLLPTQTEQELRCAAAYYQSQRACIFCQMIEQECSQDTRVVARSDQFVAYCPYASFSPYQTWITPRTHSSAFDELSDAQAMELAAMLGKLLSQMDQVLDRPDYNYLVQSAPFDLTVHASYHWRVVVFPRITTWAGFEWATGCCINPIAPEEAARQLKFTSFL